MIQFEENHHITCRTIPVEEADFVKELWSQREVLMRAVAETFKYFIQVLLIFPNRNDCR